jgi:hypothetical protein
MQTKIDFGVTDRLGRAIGYSVTKQENRWGIASREGGLYFEGQATRNGNRHQASTCFGPFANEAERDAKIEKVIEAAKKRALAPAARLKA